MVVQRCLRKGCPTFFHYCSHSLAGHASCRVCIATAFSLARGEWDESNGSHAKRCRNDGTAIADCTVVGAGPEKSSVGADNTLERLKFICRQGKLAEALCLLIEICSRLSDYLYVCLLQLCVNQRAFSGGKHVHDHILRHHLFPNIFLANTLLNFYAKGGFVLEARSLFDRMQDRDLFSWTIMIEVYAKDEHLEMALNFFEKMEVQGVRPDEICFLHALKACGNLGAIEEGKILYTCIVLHGLESGIHIGSSLVEMCKKCAFLDDAMHIFLNIGSKDVLVWNLMISACTDFNQWDDAFKCWEAMKHEGVIGNGFSFSSILKACVKLDEVTRVHVSGSFLDKDLSTCFYNSLINMYFGFEAPVEALRTFQRMPVRDVVSWNSMLSGYVQQGSGQEALVVLGQMMQHGARPDFLTFTGALKACTSLAVLEEGMEIHAFIYETGIEKNKVLTSALIDMYGKCGSLRDAQNVFSAILERDAIIWNSMISVLIAHDFSDEALKLTGKMGATGIQWDDATLVNALKACAFLGLAEKGMQLHARIFESGIQLGILYNTLIDMYLKCGMPCDALAVFNKMQKFDVVSWNVMISGYAQLGCCEETIHLFYRMQQQEVRPDIVTFLGVIKACADLGVYEHARKIQECIYKTGIGADVSIQNALVDMHAKCGRMDVANQIFENSSMRDSVSWNTLITGCTRHEDTESALAAFFEMLKEGVEPDDGTFISVLKACAEAAALEHGKYVHTLLRETQHETKNSVKSMLFDMYAKCGDMAAACKLVNGGMEEDKVSCNVRISGYAQHGFVYEALQIFCRMESKLEEWELDHVSYLSMVSACGHMGLIAEGYAYFGSMQRDSSVLPSMELFVSLVDLLGRTGLIHDALTLVDNFCFQPMVDVWMAVLSACKSLSYAEVAKCVANYVLELDGDNTSASLLLSKAV